MLEHAARTRARVRSWGKGGLAAAPRASPFLPLSCEQSSPLAPSGTQGS